MVPREITCNVRMFGVQTISPFMLLSQLVLPWDMLGECCERKGPGGCLTRQPTSAVGRSPCPYRNGPSPPQAHLQRLATAPDHLCRGIMRPTHVWITRGRYQMVRKSIQHLRAQNQAGFLMCSSLYVVFIVWCLCVQFVCTAWVLAETRHSFLVTTRA